MLNHPGRVTLTSWNFLKFLPVVGITEMKILKILASNFKWFKVYGIFKNDKLMMIGGGQIFKTEYNLQHFTRSCRIKDSDDFERDEVDTYLWRVGLLNAKEKGLTIYYIMNRGLVMFLRGRKVNVLQYWWNIVTKLKRNKWSLSKWFSH